MKRVSNVSELEAMCVICGCTDSKPCLPDPCEWSIVDYMFQLGLCSKCYSSENEATFYCLDAAAIKVVRLSGQEITKFIGMDSMPTFDIKLPIPDGPVLTMILQSKELVESSALYKK